MELLTRRNALRVSGLAFAAPVANAVAKGSILGQQAPGKADSDVSASKKIHYNAKHGDWVGHSVAHMVAKMRQGTVTGRDLRHAASAVRQYARHLQDLRFDLLSQYLADKIDVNHTDLTDTPSFGRMHAALRAHDSSVRRDELSPLFRFTGDELVKTKQSLATNGLTWHFHSAADAFHTASKIVGDDFRSHSIHPAVLTEAAMHFKAVGRLPESAFHSHGDAARLVNAQFAAVCKKILCTVLVGVVAGAATRTMIAAFAGLSASAFCTVDLIASILADLLTDGTASVLTELEIALCQAAEAVAGAGPMTVDAISAIVGMGFASVSTHLGCPAG